MIRASCRGCNIVAHYYGNITLEQIKECPPFHNQPREPGECNHLWIVTQETIGKKKFATVAEN